MQIKDFRESADALGITYRRVWDGQCVQEEIRRAALGKATHWLREADAGRGHATTLEHVRDLMDLVHEIDAYRRERAAAVAAPAYTLADVDEDREALIGGGGR